MGRNILIMGNMLQVPKCLLQISGLAWWFQSSPKPSWHYKATLKTHPKSGQKIANFSEGSMINFLE